MAIHELKDQIARLPEQPGVYLYFNVDGDTIYVGKARALRDRVRNYLGAYGNDPKTDALLEEVGLQGRSHHYPSQLSGGEQQRVALARALANDPPIVLADEPTGNLDSSNGRHIMELLRGIHTNRGTTIVLVTHDAELAAMAGARLVLRDGRVVENSLRPLDTLGVAEESRQLVQGKPVKEPAAR